MIKIFENTPYRKDKNLVIAYNEFMELLPDDAWALFRDADTLFLDPFYGDILEQAIQDNPDTGLFTCLTNRIGNPHQLYRKDLGDDIVKHRIIANELRTSNAGKYIDFNNTRLPLNGMLFLLSKKAWLKIGGLRKYSGITSNILGVDNQLHFDLRAKGITCKIIPSLYIYHWYRGGNSNDTTHLQ